ncbi:hypothetical protein SFPGR_21320 [Sulfuriferula plumbiphila]|nr:hypothetical protein SFPGR_21320 [Sulfuriferula plumbiphila]
MQGATLPTDGDLSAIWLTLRLATLTTILLLVIGTPIAWWLASAGLLHWNR